MIGCRCGLCGHKIYWNTCKHLIDSEHILCPSCNAKLIFNEKSVIAALIVEFFVVAILAYITRIWPNGAGVLAMMIFIFFYSVGRCRWLTIGLTYNISAMFFLPFTDKNHEDERSFFILKEKPLLPQLVCGSCRHKLPFQASIRLLYSTHIECPFCKAKSSFNGLAKLIGNSFFLLYFGTTIYIILSLTDIDNIFFWIVLFFLTGSDITKHMDNMFKYIAAQLFCNQLDTRDDESNEGNKS